MKHRQEEVTSFSLKPWKTKYYIALGVFVIPWFFWFFALFHASNSHFTEDELALQVIVLGGAIAMVSGAIAAVWDS